MKLTVNFVKRNFLEMLRDPVVYIFCLGFPVVMLLIFNIINMYAVEAAMFEIKSLVPAMIVFAFTFVMLTESLSVSKDRKSALLVRLYTSPMKTSHFVLGYTLPCLAVGICQEIICILFGWVLSLCTKADYFSFGAALLLMVELLPMLIICILFGVLFGSAMGEKSAPAVSSVFISAGGLLSGAWMPLETMGGFETFCRFLPFYPSVYIGRGITGAHKYAADGSLCTYTFDMTAKLGLIPLFVFMALSFVLAVWAFRRNMKLKK